MSDRDYYRQRLGEIEYRKRKDLRVMSEVIITAPKDLPVEHHREFFRQTYNFLGDRFGHENIVAAHVHMDETTPHVHIDIINEYHGRINAHEIWTRETYRTLHPDLQVYLQDHGVQANILTGITKQQGRAYTVRELKAGVRERDIQFRREKENPFSRYNRERSATRENERRTQ